MKQGIKIVRIDRNKFLGQWGVLLLALLLLAGSIAHNLYKSYTDTMVGAKQRLLSQVRVVNANLSAQLCGTAHVLQHIHDELVNSSKNAQGQITNKRLEFTVDGISGVRTISVLDRRGIVRHSNQKLLIGSNQSKLSCFQAALKNPDPAKLFVTPPFQTASGIWAINLARTIHDADGNPIGIVAATLDPDYFKILLASINYSPNMWSALAHGDGVQFLMMPERTGQQGIDLAQPGSFFTRHIDSGKSENVLTGTVYSTGENRLMALSSIQPDGLGMNNPLVVAAGHDLTSVLQEWRRHAQNQGITFAVLSLVSIAALVGFQRYQSEQIHKALEADQAILNTKQQLIDIIDFLPDATFVIDNDKKVVIWNRAIEKMSGIPKEDMIGKGDYEYTIPFYGCRRAQLIDLLDMDDNEFIAKYSQVRRTGNIMDAETFCPALYDGKGAYVWATVAPLYDTTGQRMGAIESIRDISARKKDEVFLRKLTHGIENSASAVMITDVEGRIEYVNKKFCQLTGFSASEAIGQTPRILKSDSTPREVFDNLWKTILSGKEWRGELLNRRKTGEVYWSINSISPLNDDTGKITHFIANVEDINERKNAEATIERLAYFDPLTDLPNRRMLHDRLELALKRSRRQATGAALLYIDLDSFKHINENLGHPAGDKLLREMARRLNEELSDDDIVCRLGGDEFAVILHDIKNDKDVASVTHKLLDAVAAPFQLDGCEVVVTASIGIALFPKDGDDGKTLEKNADIALFHAKEEGKNTFCFFSEELNAGSRDRIAMERGLRHLLSRNELKLHYQPKVSVATGKVVGVEALVRWNSPEFGMVSPLRFIPLAEETRLIIPIGEWVLRTACQQQLAWQKQGIKLSMAVNLSAVQFKTPQFVDRIAAIIDETGICPENLELELTESILVERPDDAVRVLEQIRSLGCGIAIDDFGTGYSSLSYLKMFPVTVLKIDRSFVRDLAHNSGDRAIAQSVVSLASNLNMQTVAEGVEEPEQLEILRQLGCTYIQGFIYSRPVLADQIPAVIRSLPGDV